MNESLRTRVIKVNQNIYDYNLQNLVSDLYSIMEEINSQMKTNENLDRNMVNRIFKTIVKALETKDYLLISDILIYDLLPNIEVNSDKKALIQQ